MTINDQYNKWKESTLKKSLEKFKERRERFETSAGIEVPRVAVPKPANMRIVHGLARYIVGCAPRV